MKVSVIGLGTWQFGGEWGRDFSQTDVDAILDRLLHNAHRIVLKGPSRRKEKEGTSEK